MRFTSASIVGLAGLAAQVSAHGLITKPEARIPGDATAAACGKTMVQFYKSDNTSYPEALLRANPSGLKDGYDAAKCDLWLCKGYQFADNKDRVQKYKTGDVVEMEAYIRIPHSGYANVSVVDTATNSVIGKSLIDWPKNYAASINPPKDQTKFSVTIPELDGKCTEAGACVLQWYWLGQGQTYESCVDFTVPATAKAAIRGRSWQ